MSDTASFVRVLTSADLAGALELSSCAGWNQTAADWRVLLELDAEGCLGMECEGRLAATTTLLCYGTTLAWIGMVLTHPQYRRRGFARRLVQRAIALAETRGVRTLKLDATGQGLHLYKTLGFEEEQEVHRYSATTVSSEDIAQRTELPLPAVAGLDGQAFGADRGPLLSLLSRHCKLMGNQEGYALWRPGARASFLGPCVARNTEAARRLTKSVLCVRQGSWLWDVLPANSEAAGLASELGFRVERKLVRMVRGEAMRAEDTLVYGAAGFEFG